MNSETTKPQGERGQRSDRREDEEASPAFKVIDRRRFAADGSERSEAEAEESAPRPAAKAPAGTAAPARETSTVREASSRTEGAAPRAASPGAVAFAPQPGAETSQSGFGMPVGEAYGEETSHSLEPTFSTLVISLSTQALMLLGEVVESGQEMPARDLPSAKHLIDMLGVLQKKTAGNLDAAESTLLERILFDLRMRFVELSR